MLQWRSPNQRYGSPEEMVADVKLSPLLVYGNQAKVVEMTKGYLSKPGGAGWRIFHCFGDAKGV